MFRLIAVLLLIASPTVAQTQAGGTTRLGGQSQLQRATAATALVPNLYTTITLGYSANNSDLTLGLDFNVSGGVTVDGLCRAKNSGNSSTHTVYLIQRTPSFSILASVSIDLATVPTASVGGVNWACVALSSPILLTNGENFAIMSTEANGGDAWYGDDSVPGTFFSGVSVDGGVFDTNMPPSSVQFNGFGTFTFGPVNAVVH